MPIPHLRTPPLNPFIAYKSQDRTPHVIAHRCHHKGGALHLASTSPHSNGILTFVHKPNSKHRHSFWRRWNQQQNPLHVTIHKCPRVRKHKPTPAPQPQSFTVWWMWSSTVHPTRETHTTVRIIMQLLNWCDRSQTRIPSLAIAHSWWH